jgi:Sulfatase-modifying factor enzyme 1
MPRGSFTMGSADGEKERFGNEGPQHRVTFSYSFAVGKFSVTFDEWDACVADGGCRGYKPSDQRRGRGRRPVINVSWDDGNAYLASSNAITRMNSASRSRRADRAALPVTAPGQDRPRPYDARHPRGASRFRSARAFASTASLSARLLHLASGADLACRAGEHQLLQEDETSRCATISVRFGLKMTHSRVRQEAGKE